jgi:hypothetical protein
MGFIPANFTSVMMFYMISFLLDPLLAFIWARKVISEFPVNNQPIKALA